MSVDEGKYRKPRTGMWEKLEREGNGSIHLDKEQSFYVGDSAGRHKTTVSCYSILFQAGTVYC